MQILPIPFYRTPYGIGMSGVQHFAIALAIIAELLHENAIAFVTVNSTPQPIFLKMVQLSHERKKVHNRHSALPFCVCGAYSRKEIENECKKEEEPLD